MKRAKLGDVYAFKTDRGYRIIHWAYSVERRGNFSRIFPGFYQEKPQNIEEFIDGECMYIAQFTIAKLYRKGLLEHWGNFPISEKHPLPTMTINYVPYPNVDENYGKYEICEFSNGHFVGLFYGDHTGKAVPEEYHSVKLINRVVDPIWFLYLLSSDFDLQHWNLFWPGKQKWNEYEKIYGDILFGPKKET